MEKTFQINNIITSIFGLPTMALFIHQDNLGIFKEIGPASLVIAWMALAVVILISMIQIWKVIFDPEKTICRGDLEINQKMLSIVEEAGNTCILSRNLSWANGHGIMDALLRKAKSGDLTLFIHQENKETRKLTSSGARVVPYKGVIPKCRFTIKGYGGANSRLYIAKANSPDHHIIFRHSDKDDVTLRLAEDLVRILEATR